MSSLTPLQILRSLEANVRQVSVGLPEQQQIAETWSGIGFKVGDHYFASSMAEVTELFRVPPYTRLPNVKPWVLGIANVRGRLIPIIDLCLFLDNESGEPMRNRRILVIEQNEQSDGLVVDGVEGMQYFLADSFVDKVPEEIPETFKPFVSGYFIRDNRVWSQFDMKLLGEFETFQDVAV